MNLSFNTIPFFIAGFSETLHATSLQETVSGLLTKTLHANYIQETTLGLVGGDVACNVSIGNGIGIIDEVLHANYRQETASCWVTETKHQHQFSIK